VLVIFSTQYKGNVIVHPTGHVRLTPDVVQEIVAHLLFIKGKNVDVGKHQPDSIVG